VPSGISIIIITIIIPTERHTQTEMQTDKHPNNAACHQQSRRTPGNIQGQQARMPTKKKEGNLQTEPARNTQADTTQTTKDAPRDGQGSRAECLQTKGKDSQEASERGGWWTLKHTWEHQGTPMQTTQPRRRQLAALHAAKT
jgi:hypothetical protein